MAECAAIWGKVPHTMRYSDDVSMTLTFRALPPSRPERAGKSGAAQQFRRQRPGHRPAEPQCLAVQQFNRPPGRGIGTLDAAGEIADQAFVDGHLPVGAELDD